MGELRVKVDGAEMGSLDVCPFCGVGRDAYTSSLPWRQHLEGHVQRNDPKRYDGTNAITDAERKMVEDLLLCAIRFRNVVRDAVSSVADESLEDYELASNMLNYAIESCSKMCNDKWGKCNGKEI